MLRRRSALGRGHAAASLLISPGSGGGGRACRSRGRGALLCDRHVSRHLTTDTVTLGGVCASRAWGRASWEADGRLCVLLLHM